MSGFLNRARKGASSFVGAGVALTDQSAGVFTRQHNVVSSPTPGFKTVKASATAFWGSVAYGLGLFAMVPVSSGSAWMTSPDGVTWTGRAALPSSGVWGIVFGGDRFVAVRASSTASAYSTSGTSFTAGGALNSATPNWTANFKYANGVFLAADSSTPEACTTADGVSWALNPLPASPGGSNLLESDGSKFALLSSGSGNVWSSTNGNTASWSVNTGVLPAKSWSSLTYSNGYFYALCFTDGSFYKSSDLTNWVQLPSFPASTMSSVLGAGNYLLGIGSTNSVRISSDGGASFDWAPFPFQLGANPSGFATDGSVLVGPAYNTAVALVGVLSSGRVFAGAPVASSWTD